jgi:hypothetical protein
MDCAECGPGAVSERSERTTQGYRRFRCCAFGKQSNKRSAGSLNRTRYRSDIIALVVLWRMRYRLALRDLPEVFPIRGIVFSHEAVRDWEPSSRRRWLKVYGGAGAARSARAGMSTRHTSRCTGIGVISAAPLIAPARWST